MGRRMLGYAIFYGLGVGSAIFAMALLVPVLHGGSPLAAAGPAMTHTQIDGGAAMCPYLASRGAAPDAVIQGQGSSSDCPYLTGSASSCPYLRERAREQAGSGMAPMEPGLQTRREDGWFQRAPQPRAVALLQVGHPTGHELDSAGWF